MQTFRYLIYSLLFIVTASCKKGFLEVPDKTVLLRQAYVTDLSTAEQYMRGIYGTFTGGFYTEYLMIYPEIAADNIKPVINWPYLTSHYRWSQQANKETSNFSASTFNMNPAWREGYKVNSDCSYILETVDKFSGEGKEKVSNIKAQALTLRALTHFMLVNIFSQSYNFTTDGSHAGIPYVTTSEWAKPVKRETVKDVYDKIITDLNDAIALFSNTGSHNPRMINKAAAKALLARVYLFKGENKNAIHAARETLLDYPIMDIANGYPSKLFTDQDKESLFQLTPASSSTGESFNTFFQGAYFSLELYRGSKDIGDLLTLDPQDVRNSWVNTATGGDYKIVKYPVNVIPGFGFPGAAYFQSVIRSSEVCLTAAEAYAKLGGSFEDSAKYFLDAIRKRANPVANSTTVVGQALLDSICMERRKELCFEGLRLFDLLRWKKTISRQNESDPTIRTLAYPDNRSVSPIPLSDIEISGLDQNNGY